MTEWSVKVFLELPVKLWYRTISQTFTQNFWSEAYSELSFQSHTELLNCLCKCIHIGDEVYNKNKKKERKKSIFVFVHITENFSMQCISIFEKEWWKKKKNLVVLVPNSNTQKFACSVYLKKEHGKGWKAFMVIVHIPEQLCLQ